MDSQRHQQPLVRHRSAGLLPIQHCVRLDALATIQPRIHSPIQLTLLQHGKNKVGIAIVLPKTWEL